jgi:tellurite resistance protein TerC
VSFVNGGEPIEWASHIPIWLSLVVLVRTLGITIIASLAKAFRGARADSS